jgi:nucleotide-binding universal stress UspA family protein
VERPVEEVTMKPDAPVLAGVDGSPAAFRAVTWAAREAALRHRRLSLLYVNTWPTYMTATWPGLTGWDVAAGHAAGLDVLESAARAAHELQPALDVDTHVAVGPATQTLVEAAAGAALLVVGRHGGHGLTDRLAGSSAAQIAQFAACPTVVVPEIGVIVPASGPGVVLGVDIGEHARAAVGLAFDEAARRDLPLTAVRAWTLFSDEPALRADVPLTQPELEAEQRRLAGEALAGWSAKYPEVDVRHRVVRQHAATALVHAGRDAALLVVGARGAGGFRRLLLGSVTESVVRHATCPVVVAR